MAYTAKVYNVMIASPGDVKNERRIARDIILDWNNINSFRRKVVLMPLSWEYNSIPSTGRRPQEFINIEVLSKADLLVGIFWNRIGTPTGKAVSGTVEEIEHHIKKGKPAMLYFSNAKTSMGAVDFEQYDAVKKLKQEYQGQSLYDEFTSSKDFEMKFRRHLAMKLNTSDFVQGSQEVEEVDAFRMNERPVFLSELAKSILIRANDGSLGQIMWMNNMEGLVVEAGCDTLIETNNAREKARWEAARDELLMNNFIEDEGGMGQIFTIKNAGYVFLESIQGT